MNVLFCMNVPVVAILMLNSPCVRLWHQFWTEENKLCFPEVAWEYFNYQRLDTVLLRCFFHLLAWYACSRIPLSLARVPVESWRGRWLPSSGRHSLEKLKLWEILDIASFGERMISQQVSFFLLHQVNPCKSPWRIEISKEAMIALCYWLSLVVDLCIGLFAVVYLRTFAIYASLCRNLWLKLSRAHISADAWNLSETSWRCPGQDLLDKDCLSAFNAKSKITSRAQKDCQV